MPNLLLHLPRWLVWGLIALPVFVFGGLLYTYAVNIPWFDDVEAFVAFMPAYDRAPTLTGKLHWLIKPNNEHRIFFGKLVTVGLTRLTGELNFRYIILVGGVCLFGILGTLFRVFHWQKTWPLVLFVPVPFLLLQPQYHLASLWTITSMQHIGATFFVLLGSYALSAPRSTGLFWLGVAAQCMAALSMSNGLFGWVAGAVLLLAQRRYGKLAIWLLISALVFWFYFHDFASPQGNESSISFFLKQPHLVFFGFFTFVGGLFDFFPNQPILWRSVLPTLAGFSIAAATAWLLWRQGWLSGKARQGTPEAVRQRYFWLGAYGFLFVNATAVAFLRPRFGYEVMLISNYMLYPALWVCLLYLQWVTEHPPRSGRPLAIGLSAGLLVWGISYNLHWPEVHKRRQALLTFGFNQRHNAVGLAGLLGTPLANYIDQHMREVVDLGYYRYPAVHPALPDSLLIRPAVSFGPFTAQPTTITPHVDRWQVETLPSSLLTARRPAYMLLQSEQHTYLLANRAPLRLISFILNRPVVAVQVDALRGNFRPGRYRLGWVTVEANTSPEVQYTNGFLTVE